MAEAAVSPTLDDSVARERVARVDALLEEVEGAIGAVPVDTTIELVPNEVIMQSGSRHKIPRTVKQ